MASKYDKAALLADFHTGSYSQRELAKKYRISLGTVNTATKGVEKKTERLVQKKVEVIQESAELTPEELNAVEHSVQFKIQLLRDIEGFTSQAIGKAKELLTSSDSGSDFKAVIEGVDRLSVMTKLNDRHAKPTQVQQNTQNNTVARVTFRRATIADREELVDG